MCVMPLRDHSPVGEGGVCSFHMSVMSTCTSSPHALQSAFSLHAVHGQPLER